MGTFDGTRVRREVGWAVLIAVISTLGAAPLAQAGWSAPISVARAAIEEHPVVATSPRRGAILAWCASGSERSGTLRFRRSDRKGRFGPARRFWKIPPTSRCAEQPKLGVARSGAAVMVWATPEDNGFTLLARRLSANGKLGPVRTLARERDTYPGDLFGWEGLDEQLAVDTAGNATAAWLRFRGYEVAYRQVVITEASVHLRRFNADGSLGPVVDIPAEGGEDVFPRIAVEPSGRGVLVWERRTSGALRARLIGRDGRLGVSQVVSTPDHPPMQAADVALDSDGQATITWATRGAALGGEPLAVRQLSSDGVGPVHILTPDIEAASVYGPRVVVDKDGKATIAWRSVAPPEQDFVNSVKARRISADGTIGPLRTLSARTLEVSNPRVATDGLGRTTVVWRESIPGSRPKSSVKARAFASNGRLGGRFTLSAGRTDFAPYAPEVAADARGVVIAAWAASLGYGRDDRVRAARFVPRAR